MTRLFLRFYLGVLVVLLAAGFVHRYVQRQRSAAEWDWVIMGAHRGGVRLVAEAIDAAASVESRAMILNQLKEQFAYPVQILPMSDLPFPTQRSLQGQNEAVYRPTVNAPVIVARLRRDSEVVQLGPFPRYRLSEIEDSLDGWMQLGAAKISAADPPTRTTQLEAMRRQFSIAIELLPLDDIPASPRGRLQNGRRSVFFDEAEGAFSVMRLPHDDSQVVRFGPFPSFDGIEQKAATTTLAVVLLPAALAIALLLKPVAQQLRLIENAAKAIAAGDLGTRVDEQQLHSAKPLAQAFNHMANRTENLVRTQRELLQAVSHELRTPLSRMRFAIELIGSARDDIQRRQRLATLDAAASEIDELVGELLTYVRLETADQIQISPEFITVHDVLHGLVTKYSVLHPGVHFQVTCASDVGDSLVYADRSGFQRAMGNLLSNAGRFAASRVDVSIHTSTQPGGVVRTVIDVDDDGIGLPVGDRKRVFEPFVRLDDAGQSCGRGVGLGLALVKRIVTQNGGEVTALASPTGGCRMRTTWRICSETSGHND